MSCMYAVDRIVKMLHAPHYPFRLKVQDRFPWEWSVRAEFTTYRSGMYGRAESQDSAEQEALDEIERQVQHFLEAERPDYKVRQGLYEGKCIADVPTIFLRTIKDILKHDEPFYIAAAAELGRRAEQERLQPALTM